MNKKFLIRTITTASLFGVCLASGLSLAFINNKMSVAKAYSISSLPTTIDLNDSSEDEIKNYYSSLNSLSEEERQGTNLLKNLKEILKTDQKYYSYDDGSKKIWQIYEIADRDWEKSPASEISGYDESTNIITGYKYGTSASSNGDNPYLHALYVDRDVENHMHAWSLEGTTTTSHGGNGEWCIDREHIWPKSQGFNQEGEGGARGDPMHLWPGDSGVNSALHSNYFYGFVDTSDSSSILGYTWEYTKNNYSGKSLTLGTSISSSIVFEPQDCDKGDIARAVFYMIARYNYLSGSDSDGIDTNNPNLTLIQSNAVSAGSYTSSETLTGKMGILSDLLAWHHLDPVDEFEIHRNNLLYKNYTNNRNPFIDYPDWVDYIWGTAVYNDREFVSYDSTPTGYADVENNIINGLKVNKIEVTHQPDKTEYNVGDTFDKTGLVVIATYEDNTTADVTNQCSYKVDMSTAGEQTVTISYRGQTAEITITLTKRSIPIWVYIVAGAVILIIVIAIFAGVITVNKKGKIKVKKSAVKKIVKSSSSKKKTKK